MVRPNDVYKKVKKLSEKKGVPIDADLMKNYRYQTAADWTTEYNRIKNASVDYETRASMRNKGKKENDGLSLNDYRDLAKQLAEPQNISLPRHGNKAFWKNKYEELKKISYYTVSIKFDWKRQTDDDSKYSWKLNKTWTITMNLRSPNELPIGLIGDRNKIIKPDGNELLNKVLRAGWYYGKLRVGEDYEIDLRNVAIISVQAIHGRPDLTNQPLFKSSLCYPSLGLKGSETGLCGYEVLLKEYPKKAQSIESLEQFFLKDRTQGLTLMDFYKFAKHHNVSLYGVDLGCRLIKNYIAENTNGEKAREEQALVIVIANSHVYLQKGKKKEAIIKSTQKDTKIISDILEKPSEEGPEIDLYRIEKHVKTIPENLQPDTYYYIDVDDLNDYYMEQLNNNIVYPSKVVGDKVVAIFLENDVRLYASPDYTIMRGIADSLNIPFTNQNLGKLARLSFDDYCQQNFNTVFKECYYNNEMRRHLNHDLFKGGAFNWTFEDFDPKVYRSYKVRGMDQRKQYSYLMKQGDIPFMDIDCSPKRFDGVLEKGFYFCSTNNFISNGIPLRGNGYYDYKLVAELLKDNVLSKENIKFYLPYKTHSDRDAMLKGYINHIYEQAPKYGKYLANPLNGCFNVTTNKYNLQTFITDSWVEASHYFHQYNQNATITTLENGLHRIQTFENAQRLTDNRIVYKAIVDRGNLETYRLMKYIKSHGPGYKILKWRTDCIYYAYNDRKCKKIPLLKQEQNDDSFVTLSSKKHKEEHGNYRDEEKIPDDFKISKEQKQKEARTEMVVCVEPQWIQNLKHLANDIDFYDYTNILEYDRVFIKGFAGSGKSFMIEKLRKNYLGDSFGYIAFTHTAANNINGQTGHSFLGMSLNSKIGEKRFKSMIQNFKGIIVDEINQLPLSILRILCMLPNTFKLYGFGDARQELPVEPHLEKQVSYLDTSMFNHLFHRNLIVLRKQCRADSEYANMCMKYHDLLEEEKKREAYRVLNEFITPMRSDFYDFLKSRINSFEAEDNFNSHELMTDINIVKTNQLRKLINHYWMKSNKGDEYMEIKSEDDKLDSEQQDLYLYKGLPVISRTTRYAKKFKQPENISPLIKKLKRKVQNRLNKICRENSSEAKVKPLYHNNEMLIVSDFNEERVILTSRILNKTTIAKKKVISLEDFKKDFLPSYAMTTYKIEGATIDRPHAIWEFNRMSAKSRYTALTRTTNCEHLIVYNMKWLPVFLENTQEGYECNIYKISSPLFGNSAYIGSTKKTIEERLSEHKNDCKTGKSKLYSFMRKYGPDNFTIELLETFKANQYQAQLQRERYYIEEYDTVNNGLNSKYV